MIGALVVAALLARFADPIRIGWLRNLLVVFGSLLVEAMPFIMLGATVSAAIEVLVPTSAFARLGRLPRTLQLPAAAAAGIAFPVCECGSVPVARRLAAKGLAPSAAITFMLAAPIVNPVVIASTFVAYRGRSDLWVMVIGRFILGFIVAMTVGWVVGRVRAGDLLRTRDARTEAHAVHEDEARWARFFGHLAGDVIFMARFLIVRRGDRGSRPDVRAELRRRPRRGPAGDQPVAMMVLAFLMSLCSESDAFVAASFVSFGPAAQLAFLVSGPMIDMKLSALYVGTYQRGFLRVVIIAVAATTLVATMWVQVVFG